MKLLIESLPADASEEEILKQLSRNIPTLKRDAKPDMSGLVELERVQLKYLH